LRSSVAAFYKGHYTKEVNILLSLLIDILEWAKDPVLP